jgi:serine/threonine protein phosphatase 1
LAVIGDIHGDAIRLRRAIDVLARDSDTHIVFTGDYVNRGPDSKAVLDLLIGLREDRPSSVTFLRGNHEAALMAYLNGGELSDFAAHGGLATVRSYLASVRTGALDEFRSSFPEAHRDFLESLACFYESDEVLISHSGFNPAFPDDRSNYAMYGGSYPELFEYRGPWPRGITVCGHYVQGKGQPYLSRHFICIDTGCGTLPGGLLTVLDLPSCRYRQF